MFGVSGSLVWLCCWMIALANYERGADEATDWMKPPAWSGNFWDPAATRARLAGQLPPLPTNPAISRWKRFGRDVLREGDIVFRLGDARALRGIFHLSWFIARATGSPFSHTAIVAIEDGSPVVYDCSAEGVRRMPFEAWTLECVGSFGVKRLKPEHRCRIPGVVGFCRAAFEQQVPFDFQFGLDDSALYCVELTEKAFRSQGLKLSDPVRIGDWEHLTSFPLTALAMADATRLVVGRPITLEQRVYVPGNDRHGIWASPLLETVFGPEPKGDPEEPPVELGRLSLRGDFKLAVLTADELRRSYSEEPIRLIGNLTLHPWVQRLLADADARTGRARPKGACRSNRMGSMSSGNQAPDIRPQISAPSLCTGSSLGEKLPGQSSSGPQQFTTPS